MKAGQKLWTREELILAINLYCKLPFGKIHRNNPDIKNLASLIGRNPGAVSFKLVNFASFDPSLKARGIKGAANSSKLDKQVWDDFYNNWDELSFESEILRLKLFKVSLLDEFDLNEGDLPKEGKIREQVIKARVNQNFFRRIILASYNNRCCITGLQQPDLLISSHIRPWNLDVQNRLNPHNGLAINALHDKAFENGLLTITPDYKIRISSILLKQKGVAESIFKSYHNKDIILPSRFLPDKKFLEYHSDIRFKP
jgi:putative restriction endonuclease